MSAKDRVLDCSQRCAAKPCHAVASWSDFFSLALET